MIAGPGAVQLRVEDEGLCLQADESETGMLDGISPQFFAPDNSMWHVHVDLALHKNRSGDAAGLALGRIAKSVEEKGTNADNQAYSRIMHTYEIPLVTRIVAPVGGQIMLGSVVRLILQLKQLRHFNITSFSFDQFQSADLTQQLMLAGMLTAGMHVGDNNEPTGMPKPFSVSGRAMQPYREVLEAANDRRLAMAKYAPLRKELRALEMIGPGMAPDHPVRGCFTGETRIPLLDGTTPQIADLDGKEVWVYSATPSGDLVPGKARGRMTKQTRDLVDVTLDDGRTVRCTPEHLWMLRNGTYKEAQSLVAGIDRLMPCKRFWPVNGGYERYTLVNGPAYDKKRHLTHRLICEAAHGPIPDGWLVHHLNGNKTDNRPENLEATPDRDHARHHAAERHAVDPEWRKAMSAGTRRFNERRDYSQTRYPTRSDVTVDRLPREGSVTEAGRLLACDPKVIERVLREHGYSGATPAAIWSEWITGAGENHRVRRVERVTLAKAVPVYDLEVDVWSNFALDAGVYVHNSKDCADAVAGVCGYLAAFGHEAYVGVDDYPTYTIDEVVPDYEPAMAFGPESAETEMVADDFIAFGPE